MRDLKFIYIAVTSMAKPKNPKGASEGTNGRGRQPISWAQSMRDMVVASINRGQLPVFGLFLVLLLILWRLPEADLSKLVFELVASFKNGEYLGWVLFVITGIGWYSHARIMRKVFSTEAERIGHEKSDLQRKLAGTNYKSSNKS